MTSTEVPQSERVHVDLDPAAVLDAYVGHRRRFAAEVATLDEEALRTQSRCTEWSVADVLRHCADVDDWMQAIWPGGRPPFTSFDPLVTPHEFVIAGREMSDLEARDRYVRSAGVMATDVSGSGPDRWGAFGVSPLGIVPWWLSVMHVFWDSWLHERDALLPLGLDAPFREDERLPVFAYSLALVGTMIREPRDLVIAGVRLQTGTTPVFASPVVAEGDAQREVLTLTDALNGRGDLGEALPEADADLVHELGAMSRLFRGERIGTSPA